MGDRSGWDFHPLAGVGPLRFRSRYFDVLNALGEDSAHIAPEQRAGAARFDDVGVATYYSENGLSAVSVDALRGPQVSLAGIELTGRVPSEVEGELEAYGKAVDTLCLRRNSGAFFLPALGLILRTQRSKDTVLSRPVFLDEPGLPPREVVRREWLAN